MRQGLFGMVIAAALLAVAAPARGEGASVLGWLDAACGQWPVEKETATGTEDGGLDGTASSEEKPFTLGAGFRMWIFARPIKTTHVSGRPRTEATVWQHSQVDDDSSWFVVHRVGAIRLEGSYRMNESIRLSGAVLLGAQASTLEYRLGPGNAHLGGATNTEVSLTIDSKVGWYPLDMYFGLEVEGSYRIQDFSAKVRWSMNAASAYFEESWMLWGKVDGYITIFTNDFDVTAGYKTKFGTPYAGLGLSLYEGWSHQEEVDDPTPADYKFHFRETQWFQVLAGYRVDLESGHFMAAEFSLVSQWSFRLEMGYKF